MVKSYMGQAATFSIHSPVCYAKNHLMFLAEFEVSDGFLCLFLPFFEVFVLFAGETSTFFGIFEGDRAARRRTKVPPGPPEKALRWRRNVGEPTTGCWVLLVFSGLVELLV